MYWIQVIRITATVWNSVELGCPLNFTFFFLQKNRPAYASFISITEILKINKSVDYRSFWHTRTSLREKQERYNESVYGKRLVWSFILENNLKNYIGLLDYTLTYYRMELLDQSELEVEDDTKN